MQAARRRLLTYVNAQWPFNDKSQINNFCDVWSDNFIFSKTIKNGCPLESHMQATATQIQNILYRDLKNKDLHELSTKMAVLYSLLWVYTHQTSLLVDTCPTNIEQQRNGLYWTRQVLQQHLISELEY